VEGRVSIFVGRDRQKKEGKEKANKKKGREGRAVKEEKRRITKKVVTEGQTKLLDYQTGGGGSKTR